MTHATELTPLLKRLQLGPMVATLPERIALARREQLDYASFLEIILSDEVNRRAHRRTELRLHNAGFEETCRLEDFDWSASITPRPPSAGRRLLTGVSRQARARPPGGTGWRRQELSRSGSRLFRHPRRNTPSASATPMTSSRPCPRPESTTRQTVPFGPSWSPDLLILHDLGLHGLTAQQSADLYELILNRHRSSSFVITSNRAADEWLSLFDDPILSNSALDRLTNTSYQIVIEGPQLSRTALAAPRPAGYQRG